MIKRFGALDSKGSRVWLLFGSKDGKEWTCLQMAQSKEKARLEAEEAIELIFRKEKAGVDGQTISYFAEHPEEVK